MRSYDVLRAGSHLSGSECRRIIDLQGRSYQLASLAVLLLHQARLTVDEEALLEWIITNHKQIIPFVGARFATHPFLARVPQQRDLAAPKVSENNDFYRGVIASTGKALAIGKPRLHALIERLMSNEISLDFLAVWLMVICIDGLSESDVMDLTSSMVESGEVFDYRKITPINKRKLIRRYPTGALSEKVALILPSLIASLADEYPIASTFLVGKSLGFTGGTWDKLNSIPGFRFPEPGEETIDVLRECNVAMCVTKDTLDPADRLLYQFRSVTGTINSIELIVASIASKQLSTPPDLLLLDVRYGDGAFMGSLDKGRLLLASLARVIRDGGVDCIGKLTRTDQPNGMAIGNSVEVAEAASIITGRWDKEYWDSRALIEQRRIVLGFAAAMFNHLFPGKSQAYWRKLALDRFRTGEVERHFRKVLSAHEVTPRVIDQLCEDPCALIRKTRMHHIYPTKSGILRNIDQKRLGYILNFALWAGGNIYSQDVNTKSGLLLRKRLGDNVDHAHEICIVLDDSESLDASLAASISECFRIE